MSINNKSKTKSNRRCGTCKFFSFGMRSFCTWEPPKEWVLPSSWVLLPSVWVDDHNNCPTWVQQKENKHV